MRLIDFNTSTAHLSGSHIIYVEINHQSHPISELNLGPTGQIILITNLKLKPLTLNQFQARVSQLNPDEHFYYQDTDTRLFGYRLDNNNILLG